MARKLPGAAVRSKTGFRFSRFHFMGFRFNRRFRGKAPETINFPQATGTTRFAGNRFRGASRETTPVVPLPLIAQWFQAWLTKLETWLNGSAAAWATARACSAAASAAKPDMTQPMKAAAVLSFFAYGSAALVISLNLGTPEQFRMSLFPRPPAANAAVNAVAVARSA
jgi:hypothetical protein